jgi:CheY-like chemotaxis protein
VAKILVADDNSNIQKMVSVVLKDQGIDVVAVGNGEAAVRKISDVKPDLILADVFMPVRNGYEVCKYVKGDSSLAHIPVILLVGAFDPLDEQEAQRVGADGVLKKPFVPPDPLISMVKSALVRASSGQVASIAVERPAPPPKAAEITGGIPTVSVQPSETGTIPPPQPAVEDIPSPPAAVKIDSASQPLAFGSLLQAPPTEMEEDDAAFVTPNKELLEREWHAGDEDEEQEEEEEQDSSSWRRDGGSETFGDEVDTAKEKPAAKRKKRETWTPTREKQQNLIDPEEPEYIAPPITPLAPKVAAPAPASPLGPKTSVPTPPPAPPVASEPWKKTAPPAPIETKKAIEPVRPPAAESSPPPAGNVPATFGTAAPTGKEPEKASTGGSWFSVSSSPWDAEAQKANQLASAWDAAPAAPPAPTAPSASAPETAEPAAAPEAQAAAPDISYDFVSEEPSTEPVVYTPDPNLVRNEVVSNERLPDLVSDEALSPEAVETIRQETSYVLEDAAQEAIRRTEEADKAKSRANEPEQAAALDVEALVAKVLAKMNPEMLQAVTREILKPVVEAMVREEMKPKK